MGAVLGLTSPAARGERVAIVIFTFVHGPVESMRSPVREATGGYLSTIKKGAAISMLFVLDHGNARTHRCAKAAEE